MDELFKWTMNIDDLTELERLMPTVLSLIEVLEIQSLEREQLEQFIIQSCDDRVS